MMTEHPDEIRWGPARSEHGLELQNLDGNGHEILMRFYGINAETLEHAGRMAREPGKLEDAIRALIDAPIHLKQQ